MDAIEPEERSRLIEEAMKGRDNIIRYNLQSTNDWQFQQEIDGLKYFTRPTTSPHEIHGQISGVIFQPPLFVLHHFAVWKYRSKYERDYLQMSKIPLDETSLHQVHLVHGVYRPVLFLIKRDHVGVEYIGKIQYEGSEYHVASLRNVQTSLIPLYKDFDRVDLSIGLTIEPRNEGRYSFVKYTVIMKLDRVSPNFCGKVQGMLKSAVMCKQLSCVPQFKLAWETEDEDDPMTYPVKLVLSDLREKINSSFCEDLPTRSSQFLRGYAEWPWEQVGSFDEVQLSSLHDPKLVGDFNLAWKMTFTSTLLHPVAQLLSFDTTFNRLLWDPCTTSVQILFEDNPYLVLLVKGGGWETETGCTPFKYVCRTYAVAGENYDWIYEEHDNGDVFLFKLAASTEDFSITIVDVLFLVKSENWEFKLNAKQYNDIISLTLTDLFVNAVVEIRNVLVSGVSISTSIRNQIRSRKPRTPRQRPRMPQKESSLEKLKKHARTADQLKIHGNVAASICRRPSYRMLPPPIVFQPSPRNSIDLEFSKIDFSRQFSIAILPDEILMEIFALLSVADLCKVAQVCIHWKKISEDHALWAFDPESIFSSSIKGEEWLLFFTSSNNIYSTNDSPDAFAVRDLVGDGASIKLPGSPSPSPAPSPTPASAATNSHPTPPSNTVSILPLNSSTPFSTQPHNLTSPYTAAYNYVYNTYANQGNSYPFASHPFTSHQPHANPPSHPPPPPSSNPVNSTLPSFSHFTTPLNSNVANNSNNINNNNNNNNNDNNNNNSNSNNTFNTVNSSNIQYAFKKLKEFDQGEDKGDKEDKEDDDSEMRGAEGGQGGGTAAVGGPVGDVDVDTLNPNIYSISINDGPAETINVGTTRRRFASAWPYKENMEVEGESNPNSEPNSGLNSANTSYTNFFELSVPSVHEFVRKSFRNFHPRRRTYEEERPKNIKRVTMAYGKALDNWVTGKFKRTHTTSEPIQCPVECLTVSDNDKKAYCGFRNGLLNVFELNGTIARFRLLPHPITDIAVDGMFMYIGMANGTCCQINNVSNKIAKEYSLYDDDHMDITVGFGRSPSVIYTWDNSAHNVDLHNWTSDAVVTFNNDCTATCVELGSQRMVVGQDDGSIALWDVADPSSPLLHFRSHELEPTCAQLNPCERVVTSGSRDGCVMVWDERAGPYYVKRFKSKAYEIKAIETKEYKLIVGMNNGTVAYWDPRYLIRPLHSWRLHEKGAAIVKVKLFPTETHLVCAAADGFVGMYDFS